MADNLEIEPADTDVSDDLLETTEDAEELEAEASTEDDAEPESSEDEDSPDLITIGEDQITVDDYNEMKKQQMLHSDYSRKRATESAEHKAKLADVQSKAEALDVHLTNSEKLLDEEYKAVDWDELREDDTASYLKQKESFQARRDGLTKAKSDAKAAIVAASEERDASEQQKLVNAKPEWVDDAGNSTELYQDDMKAISDYQQANDWSADDKNAFLHHKHALALVDAAKYHALKRKGSAAKKELKKKPAVAKPSQSTSSEKSAADILYGDS